MVAHKKTGRNKSDQERKENQKDGKKDNELELLKNQLTRALADYSNLEKRVEREREGFFKFANLDLVKRLLPVIDMLDQAQHHLADSGLAIALKEFKDILKEDGVEEVVANEGDDFNEELFEAVEAVDTMSENKDKAGKVAEMLMPGWRYLDGTVIRPVKVKVYKKE